MASNSDRVYPRGIPYREATDPPRQRAPSGLGRWLQIGCRFSLPETRLLPFVAEMKPRGLAIVAINPNHPDAVRLDELGYSKYNDSFDEMKLYAKEKGFKDFAAFCAQPDVSKNDFTADEN